MNDPTVIVTIRQAASGGFSAELAGHPEALSAPDFATLLDRLRDAYAANGAAEVAEDDVADESFERDLEETLAENAELFRRLAQ
jgi:hypothetical protein